MAGTAPSLDAIGAMAERALARLPPPFREHLGRVVVRVAELAGRETLDALGIDDPFELTGLYHGVALTEKSAEDIAAMPDEIWLYRRAILEEWAARGDVTLEALVEHVLIHEIAHHFGWSDDDIASVDDWRL